MTATAYQDAINGQPLTIAIDAIAWAEPLAASWLKRCRELNRLLAKATHLLRIAAKDGSETSWYAGVAGTSLAAGLERMAIAHEDLRDQVVVLPLDARVYVADIRGGLVRAEWVLYPDAFQERVQTWRQAGRGFTLLTGGGRQAVDLPNAATLPVDIDTATMTFRHASLALLRCGLLRWRDGVTLFVMVALALAISSGLAWWRHAPTVEPVQRLKALVTQPSAPVRYNASAELLPLALLSATYDRALWQANQTSNLVYDVANASFELRTFDSNILTTQVGRVPKGSAVPSLSPYTLRTFHEALERHLESTRWTTTFGEPYLVSSDESEQHVNVELVGSNTDESFSIAGTLVDLSRRLRQLPITLHRVECNVLEGRLSACKLALTIRGISG